VLPHKPREARRGNLRPMSDRVLEWQALLREHLAAREALDAANSSISVLTVPVEHLEAEFRTATLARAKLLEVRGRMDRFDRFDPDHAESLPIG
jgi:hypothetical protein